MSFLLILSLFTTIPTGGVEFNNTRYKKGIIFIPLVGLIIGFILYLLKTYIFKDFLEIDSILLIFFYVIITGGLHLDGLSDTVDGIFSRKNKSRILEIMSDSNIGAFGVISLIIWFLFAYKLFKYSIIVLVFSTMISRYSVLIFSFNAKYAKKEGMGKLITKSISSISIIFWFILINILLYFFLDYISIICFALIILNTFLLRKYFYKKISGITGDTIGFTIEINQILFILSYYIISKF